MNLIKQIDRHIELFPNVNRDAVIASRLLFRASHLLEREINMVLAQYEIDMQGYIALAVINSEDNFSMQPRELGVSLNATKVQITRLIDRLEAKGWAARSHSKTDRRCLNVCITESGSAQLKQIAPLVHKAYSDVWGNIPSKDIAATINSLSQINNKFLNEKY